MLENKTRFVADQLSFSSFRVAALFFCCGNHNEDREADPKKEKKIEYYKSKKINDTILNDLAYQNPWK